MGENSKIPWTDDTFNPWHGCSRTSAACTNCYAEGVARRFGTSWGPKANRRFFDDKHWNEPLRWNRRAHRDGVRRRVFCGSMCDVFEGRNDLDSQRERLWHLIGETPQLDWLLLTKRPENFKAMLPTPWKRVPQQNVWLGVTAETQKDADRRIPLLLDVEAVVHFVSCEPILEEVRLTYHLHGNPRVNWVICGDESGRRRRPADLDWARTLRDECEQTNTAYFFKQWHRLSHLRGDRDLGNVIKVECPELDGRTHREFPG